MRGNQTSALGLDTGWRRLGAVLVGAVVLAAVSLQARTVQADDSIRFVDRVNLSDIAPETDQGRENIRAELDVPLDFLDLDRATDPIRLRPLDDNAPFSVKKLPFSDQADTDFALLRQTAHLRTALRHFDGRWSLMHGAQRALGENIQSLHQTLAQGLMPGPAGSGETMLQASGGGVSVTLGDSVQLSASVTAFLEHPSDPLAGVSELTMALGQLEGRSLDLSLLMGRFGVSFGYLQADGFGFGRMQTYALGIAYMGDRFSTYLTASRLNMDPSLLMLADVDEVLALEWGAAYRLHRSLFLFGRIRVADYSTLYGLGLSGLNSLYFVGTRYGF